MWPWQCDNSENQVLGFSRTLHSDKGHLGQEWEAPSQENSDAHFPHRPYTLVSSRLTLLLHNILFHFLAGDKFLISLDHFKAPWQCMTLKPKNGEQSRKYKLNNLFTLSRFLYHFINALWTVSFEHKALEISINLAFYCPRIALTANLCTVQILLTNYCHK